MFSSLGLLQITLLWLIWDKSFCEYTQAFLLGTYLSGSYSTLTHAPNFYSITIMIYQFISPLIVYKSSSWSVSLPTLSFLPSSHRPPFLLFFLLSLLPLTILRSKPWYLYIAFLRMIFFKKISLFLLFIFNLSSTSSNPVFLINTTVFTISVTDTQVHSLWFHPYCNSDFQNVCTASQLPEPVLVT